MKFYHPHYRVACAGHETPFHYQGKVYLYVWNLVEKRHEYYVKPDDVFIPDSAAPWLLDELNRGVDTE